MGDTILPQLAAASGGEPVLASSGGFSHPFTAYQCLYQTGDDPATVVYAVVVSVRAADGGRAAAEANFADGYTKTTSAGESIFSKEGAPVAAGVTPGGSDEAVVNIVSDDAYVVVGSASGGADALARNTAWAHEIDTRMHVQPPITAQATPAPAN